MKALFLAAVLAAVGTPAMAQNGWNYGNASAGNCRSNAQSYGRPTYQNGNYGANYGSGLGYGGGYGRGYSTRNPWTSPQSLRQQGSYDPVHGDFHPTANSGYGASFPRSNYQGQFYGRGGY